MPGQSQHTIAPAMPFRISPAWLLWLLVAGLWIWGLGELGLASHTELPIFQGIQRRLGGTGFPDWIRPNLGCALALLWLSWSWGKARGLSGLGCMAVIAALPITSIAARHFTPDLWAELAFSLLIWSRSCRPFGPRRRLGLELASLSLLVYCAGLWWGLALAAGLLWLEEGHRGWGALALTAALASLGAAWGLDESYHPWLLATVLDPQNRSNAVMTILSDFGLWAPWVGFAWLYAKSELGQERRWLALIWGSQLLSCLAFRPGPLLGLLPASILLVGAADRDRARGSFEALCITSLLSWALLLRTLPHFASQLAWPHTLALEFESGPGGLELVWQLQAGLLLAMLVALRWARRPWLLAGLILSAALNAQLGSRVLSRHSSVKELADPLHELQRHRTKIASYGVEDPGWSFYAPSSWTRLDSMQAAIDHLQASSGAALVLSEESAKQLAGRLSHSETPLHEVERAHTNHLVLINQAGAKTPGSSAAHPFRTFDRLTQVPPLTHRCRVVFDESLELLGWQFTTPLKRGGSSEFQAVFRVLKPLQGPHHIVPQLRDRLFRPWPSFESPSSADLFPISAWQEGDLILFTKSFHVPWLLTRGGPLELSLGLAKSRYSYKPITFPVNDPPKQQGLRWLGKKRRRIVLGKVQIDSWLD